MITLIRIIQSPTVPVFIPKHALIILKDKPSLAFTDTMLSNHWVQIVKLHHCWIGMCINAPI